MTTKRKLIKGEHLAGTVKVYDKKGNLVEEKPSGMMMLPAKDGTCEECASVHEPEQAHNAQSLFYQYFFYNKHRRWPNWKDAIAHCSEDVKAIWIKELGKLGVDVESGQVNPRSEK